MINTLRLARRWKQAGGDPEKMVEALAEELDTIGDLRSDVRLLKWMTGFVLALEVGILFVLIGGR
jgi:hypothetical protein